MAERRSYEEMLAELLALNGRHVLVGISLRYAGARRLLAALQGTLLEVEFAELADIPEIAAELGVGEGELAAFRVGDKGGAHSALIVRAGDFKNGLRHPNGRLTFAVGRAGYEIRPHKEEHDG